MSNFRNIIQLGKLTGSLLTANDIDLEEGMDYLQIAIYLSKDYCPDHPIILSALGYGCYKSLFKIKLTSHHFLSELYHD